MKMGAVIKGLIVAMVVGASLIVAALARAAEPTAAPSVTGAQTEIRVRVIHAKTAPATKFDPHLEDLKKFLQNFTNYDFRQVIDQSLTLGVNPPDNTKGIGLLSGKNLNVTLLGLTREKATMRLELVGQTGQMLDTTVSAGPHKLFFIAGPRYDNGVLFIAIEPHYEPDSISSPAVSDGGNHPVQ